MLPFLPVLYPKGLLFFTESIERAQWLRKEYEHLTGVFVTGDSLEGLDFLGRYPEGIVIYDPKEKTGPLFIEKIIKQFPESRYVPFRPDAEEILIKNDRIFSVLNHDVRGPIGGYKLLVEALGQDFDLSDTEELKSILNMIQKGLGHTLNLLENIILWGRIPLNRLPFEPSLLRLHLVLETGFEDLEKSAQLKDIRLIRDFSPESLVFADENMLRTILKNLLSNAIKFSTTGTQVVLSAQPEKSGLKISIIDEGIGIPLEKQPQLMDNKNHYSTFGTGDEKGSGIGLLLCRDLIHMHRGRLQWQSVPDKGSTFEVFFPHGSS